MDIKYNFAFNPLRPVYNPAPANGWVNAPASRPVHGTWVEFTGGPRNLGAEKEGFSFDNERPRHITYLEPYMLGERPVTCAEYISFIEDKGYERPELWLSDGWEHVRNQRWEAPLYWEKQIDGWWHYTLHGMRPVDPAAPVCHVSFFEADAYARWANRRLPTEAEWESALGTGNAWRAALAGSNLLDSGLMQPSPARGSPAGERVVPGLRRRLGMDAKRLRPVPGVQGAARRPRRVQRKVHEQPAGSPRRQLRDAGVAHPADLP